MRVEGRRPSGAEAGRIAGRQPASRCLDERGTPVRASRPDPSGPVAGRSPRWVPTLRILPHTPLRVHPDSAVSRSIDTDRQPRSRGRRVAPAPARTTHARLVRKGEASRSDGTYRDRHRPSATARVVRGCSRIQQRSGRTEIPIVRSDPRRPLRRLTAALRRRPRTVGVASLVVVIGAVGILGLAAIPRSGEASRPGPTFSYAGTWDLLQLQRHIDAGEVVALTPPGDAGEQGTDDSVLLAKLRDGQVIRVALDVTSAQAMDALANLGHGDLLTTEAWQAVKAARAAQGPGASEPLRTILAVVFPLALVAVLAILLMRVLGRQSSGTRDVGSRFTTVLPATAKGDNASSAAAPDRSSTGVTLADVAGCDEAKLELTETIEFLRDPGALPRAGRAQSRAASCSTARPAPARRCSPGGRRRGRRAVPLRVGLGVRREVRRRRRAAHPRPVRPGPQARPRRHLLRRVRRDRQGARRPEQPRGARADAQPAARRARRLRHDRRRRRHRRDEPARHPRLGGPPARAASTARSTSGCPTCRAAATILDVHARNKPLADDDRPRGAWRARPTASPARMLADLLNEAAILAARRDGDAIDARRPPRRLAEGRGRDVAAARRWTSASGRSSRPTRSATRSAARSTATSAGSRRSACSPTARRSASRSAARRTTTCRPSPTCARGSSR